MSFDDNAPFVLIVNVVDCSSDMLEYITLPQTFNSLNQS